MLNKKSDAQTRFSAYLNEAVEEYPDTLRILQRERTYNTYRRAARQRIVVAALLLLLILSAVLGPMLLQTIHPDESEAEKAPSKTVPNPQQMTEKEIKDITESMETRPNGLPAVGSEKEFDGAHEMVTDLSEDSRKKIERYCLGIRIPETPGGATFLYVDMVHSYTGELWQATFYYSYGDDILKLTQGGKTEKYYDKKYSD